MLTEAGESVHLWAREVLRGRLELDKEIQNLSAGMSGTVSIGSSISVGNTLLTQPIIAFRKANPAASIRLEITPVENALEGTRSGRHDFSVVATDAMLDNRAFSAELIHRPRWVLIAAAGNTTFPEHLPPKALGRLPFVCPPSGLAIRRSQDSALAEIGVFDRQVEIELGSAESIKQAIIADLGVALLWLPSARDEIASGLLREITIDAPPLQDKLFVVRRRGRRLSPLQRRVLHSVRESIDETFRDSPEMEGPIS